MASKDDGPPDDGAVGDDYLTDGLVHLEDISFDFEDYFKRYWAKEMSEEERAEYHARVMGIYCRDIFAQKKPLDWVLEYIANEFSKILAGGQWNDSFPLPWHPADPIRYGTRADQEALEIYCEIHNFMRLNPDVKITAAIEAVASGRNVSYEKARAGWYKHKAKLKAF